MSVLSLRRFPACLGLATCLGTALASTAGGAGALPASATAIEHVNVLDMGTGELLGDRTLIVEGEKITQVKPSAEVRVPEGAARIDGRGKFLMPGLCDMHVHVRNDPEEDFSLYLAHGVTTVRNMSDADGGWDHVALREKVRRGEILGPRYLVAGPFVDGESAGSMEDLETLLRRYEEGGYDFIKVHGDLEPEIFEALMDGSRRLGIPVVGHAQRHRQPIVSLEMKSISHMEEFLYILPWPMIGDTAQHPDLAARFAARSVAVAPTLRIYQIIKDYLDDDALRRLAESTAARYLPREQRAEWLSDRNEYRDPSGGYLRFMMSSFSTLDPGEARRLAAGKTRRRFDAMKSFTAALEEAGVLLITGSDGFGLVVPGLSLHEELETLVGAGLTPLQALQASTINVARYLGEEDRSGTVAEGKIADLILLDADPTRGIGSSRRLEGVMTRGRWLGRVELDRMLERVLRSRAEQPEGESPASLPPPPAP